MGATAAPVRTPARRRCDVDTPSTAVDVARSAWVISTIEELTGRKVAAFLSANRQDPDFAVELFVLKRDVD